MVQPHFLWILVFHNENIFSIHTTRSIQLALQGHCPFYNPFSIVCYCCNRLISASSNVVLSFNFARLKTAHLNQPPHVSHVLEVPCSLYCRFCTVHPAQDKSILLALWSIITLKSFQPRSLQLIQSLSTGHTYSTLGAEHAPSAP